jgi:hypothetical protein
MMGFKGWSSHKPCMFCTSDRKSLHNYEECSFADSPWGEYGHSQWLADIRNCLIKVRVTSLNDRDEIIASLEMRKKHHLLDDWSYTR